MNGDICMDSTRKTAWTWLLENGYPEMAEMTDEIQAEWKETGKHIRHTWWEVLAGGKIGALRTIYGRNFPALHVAQIRQRVSATANTCKVDDEEFAPANFDYGHSKKASEE